MFDDLERDGRRVVQSPLRPYMLAPLREHHQTVQFTSALTATEYKRVAELIQPHPGVELRVYDGSDGSIQDLDFLQYFPTLHHFSADSLYTRLTSIDGLGYLNDLRTLNLEKPAGNTVSLKPLDGHPTLAELRLDGAFRDIETLAQAGSLQILMLRSITLPDLHLPAGLKQLWRLTLDYGGTNNLDGLSAMHRLEQLELCRVRALTDLDPISGATTLQFLSIADQQQISRLPDMTALTHLDRIWLNNLRSLTDLTPLLTAPTLRYLALSGRHLQPAQVAPLGRHPTLTHVGLDLGTAKKTVNARALLPFDTTTAGAETVADAPVDHIPRA